ncbi:MAG: system Lon protease-like protein BrxL, partial [Pseudomonadota bacterium]
MNKELLDEKITAAFSELVIDKALVRALKIREKRTIPSYVEEWLVSRFQQSDKSDADIYADVTGFMSRHLPSKIEKETINYRLHSGESLVLLDRFEVRIDISKGKMLLTIPCLEERNASVTSEVLEKNQSLLEGGQWGAGRLLVNSTGKNNVIELVEFN